jgi:hypothetical protein
MLRPAARAALDDHRPAISMHLWEFHFSLLVKCPPHPLQSRLLR